MSTKRKRKRINNDFNNNKNKTQIPIQACITVMNTITIKVLLNLIKINQLKINKLLLLFYFILSFNISFINCITNSTESASGGTGFLDFDNLPVTRFSCEGKVIGGYYADVEAGCQMFHVCTLGQKDEVQDIKFLCLNGTVFDQETRVCERVDEVDCSQAEKYYDLNLDLYLTYSSTTTTSSTTIKPETTTTLVTTTTTTTKRPIIITSTNSPPLQRHQYNQNNKPFSTFTYYNRGNPSSQSSIISSTSNLQFNNKQFNNQFSNHDEFRPTARKVQNFNNNPPILSSRDHLNEMMTKSESDQEIIHYSNINLSNSKNRLLQQSSPAQEHYEGSSRLINKSPLSTQQKSNLQRIRSSTTTTTTTNSPIIEDDYYEDESEYLTDDTSNNEHSNAAAVINQHSNAAAPGPINQQHSNSENRNQREYSSSSEEEEEQKPSQLYERPFNVQSLHKKHSPIQATTNIKSIPTNGNKNSGKFEYSNNNNRPIITSSTSTSTSSTEEPPLYYEEYDDENDDDLINKNNNNSQDIQYYDDDTSINPNEHHFSFVDVPRIPYSKPNTSRVLITNGKPFLPRLRRQNI